MTHRSYALVLLASLWLAPQAFAQDQAAAPASSVDNEMPPPDAPRVKKAEALEAPPATGSIKDTADKRRPYVLSLQMAVPWLYSIGIGARLGGEIPIMHNGFIPGINDSFSLEPMFELSYGRQAALSTAFIDTHAMTYTPALSILWSFYFKSNLRAYLNLSFGYSIVVDDHEPEDLALSHFYHNVSVGMFYDFSQHWSVRADLGYEGLRAGIAFRI